MFKFVEVFSFFHKGEWPLSIGIEISCIRTSGHCMAVNASLFKADANGQNFISKEEWDHRRIDPAEARCAVREYLDTLVQAVFEASMQVPMAFQVGLDRLG